jgi:hypothetical protein
LVILRCGIELLWREQLYIFPAEMRRDAAFLATNRIVQVATGQL